MKLNKNFLVHKTGKETVIVPTGNAGFSGVVKGNETLGIILDYLKKDISDSEIIDKMSEEFDVSREVIERDVRETVNRLRKIGAIDE